MQNLIPMKDWKDKNPSPDPKKFFFVFAFDREGYEMAMKQWNDCYNEELYRRYNILMEKFVTQMATKIHNSMISTFMRSHPNPDKIEVVCDYCNGGFKSTVIFDRGNDGHYLTSLISDTQLGREGESLARELNYNEEPSITKGSHDR